jgi:hypothetical protein
VADIDIEDLLSEVAGLGRTYGTGDVSGLMNSTLHLAAIPRATELPLPHTRIRIRSGVPPQSQGEVGMTVTTQHQMTSTGAIAS